ncbi:type II secretion system (T2SS) protein M subtype b [Rhizobium sp. PP-F2F-G38]|nr:type II secretion system (T2SS) protein M subtype b [Rhizobium sp. PP-WC-1G-195]PYE98972.1 type II secretion system (T2SS) protein M subtype b [Rhizobium sp. PP-F2F-G38]
MTVSPPRMQAFRLSAILVFIGLPALFTTLGVLNYLQIAEDRLTVEEATRQAATLERRLASIPASTGDTTPSLTIEGSSRTAAIARLQQSILDAIVAAPGRIIETAVSESTLAEGEGEGSDEIAVTTTFDIDNDGLLRLLYQLESGLPLMTVESLSIRRLPDAEGESPGDNAQIRLRVDMAIGARWTPETAPEVGAETGS